VQKQTPQNQHVIDTQIPNTKATIQTCVTLHQYTKYTQTSSSQQSQTLLRFTVY